MTSKPPMVSIVLGTWNRRELLQKSIRAIHCAVGSLAYETIVIDGGSSDGSREWLAIQPDVVLLGERGLYGACDAYNRGFALARAPYIVHINDDAVCHPGIIQRAFEILEASEEIGQVAFVYRNNEQETYHTDLALGLHYANMGMTRTWLVHLVGGWGQHYYKYGGDTQMSIVIQMLGHKLHVEHECQVEHLVSPDDLRAMANVNEDSAIFYRRWGKGKLTPPTKPLISYAEAQGILRGRTALPTAVAAILERGGIALV